MTSLGATWPPPPSISAPVPSSRLPAGQVAVTALLPELLGLAAATRLRPGGGVAQIANAVTVQLLAVPFSSSRPCTVTLLSADVRPDEPQHHLSQRAV